MKMLHALGPVASRLHRCGIDPVAFGAGAVFLDTFYILHLLPRKNRSGVPTNLSNGVVR